MGDSLGCAKVIKHRISTDSQPIKQRYYRVSPLVQRQIDEQIEEMLALDVIEPSSSGWSSPIILVPKKDKSYRFCIDYRKLNSVTEKDAYPMPYISSILDNLKDAKFLSSIDIRSAYWQVPLEEDSKQYTAFAVPSRGLYQFKRMPFGLTNAPATFQRLVDTLFGPELEPYVFVYLDDIIVIAPTFEKHLEILEEVLKRLHTAGLTISRDKCHFCRNELHYLGFVVGKDGLHVDPEKVAAIVDITPPTSVTEIRRFIGMTSWYRKFIPEYATKIAPLTALLRKNRKFEWSCDCQASFDQLKDCLVSAPVLKCPDFQKPFVLQTDASGYGIGAVLTQEGADGEQVICYLSRSLTKAERKWSTTERELLAVLWSVEKLRCYLEGTKFTVVTDHYSLKWLDNLKDPTGRLGRWALRMQQFDFEVLHRKGKEHLVPDLLSRSVPEINAIQEGDCRDRWYGNMVKKVTEHAEKYPSFRVEQGRLFKYADHPYPELCTEADYWKEVVPKDRRLEIIKYMHDAPTSGHTGVFKTLSRLSQAYFWPKMRADVAKYVKRCHVCSAMKPEQRKTPGQMQGKGLQPTRPWEIISLDLIGPLPRTVGGYTYILVVVDYFSKFPLLFPLRNAKANTIVGHLENSVFLLMGAPKVIILDNGRQCVSGLLSKLAQTYDVRLQFTALYHPQANHTERTNREIKKMLRCYVSENHKEWGKYLHKIACAIRTSKHESIGHTPYFVNFGREMCLSGQNHHLEGESLETTTLERLSQKQEGMRRLFEEVQARLRKARVVQMKAYNLRRRHVEYRVGDQVWRRNFQLSNEAQHYTSSLGARYVGPFRVRNKIGYNVYLLEDSSGRSAGKYHVKDLKPTYPDEPPMAEQNDL